MVVDPETGTAVIVPVNPQADGSTEVTALLKGLYATGKIKPGQVGQIVVKRGNQVTEVISNRPCRNTASRPSTSPLWSPKRTLSNRGARDGAAGRCDSRAGSR